MHYVGNPPQTKNPEAAEPPLLSHIQPSEVKPFFSLHSRREGHTLYLLQTSRL